MLQGLGILYAYDDDDGRLPWRSRRAGC